ncbi:MAG: GrpB family protein [Paenibacillus sp.]|nr:GrpB family protein [Paenibacillus sp.]
MNRKPVIIEDYNNEWPMKFQFLKGILLNQLDSLAIEIEHVGSTSVPGLAAKPIIDVDIVIHSVDDLPEVIHRLSELGYFHEGDLGIKDREAFKRSDNKVPYNNEMNDKPEHHLYVCIKESEELKRHILFRELLRANPVLVEEYGMLKKELAEKYQDNRQAYSDGKTDFIISAINKVTEG